MKIFKEFINKKKLNIELLVQAQPKGMGNLVLYYKNSKFYECTDHVLLIWSDIPFKKTINLTINDHILKNNTITFPTHITHNAYTIVKRDKNNDIKEILETREMSKMMNTNSEREIGFFIFNKEIIFNFLSKKFQDRLNKVTNEHSFLYIIRHLVKNKYKAAGLQIASKEEALSVNTPNDLKIIKNL